MTNKPALTGRGRYKLKYRGTECLNCGHPLELSDKFCPNCSQPNSTKKISLKDYLDEFFGTLVSYDSRLLRTLSTLLIKPGKITKSYIDGKRVAYTNPFRFLLSLTIIYFLIINTTGDFSRYDKYGATDFGDIENFAHELDESTDENEEMPVSVALDTLKKQMNYDGYRIKNHKRDSLILLNPKTYYQELDKKQFSDRWNEKQNFFTTIITHDTLYNLDDATNSYGIPKTIENQLSFNLSNGVLRFKKAPGSFLSALISKFPFVIFFLLPVFSLFVWLIYIRKNYSYTDHLIFSFHNTALLFILLIISYLIGSIFKFNSNWIFLLIFSVYLFAAMWNFYGQGIFKTIVKYLFLNTIFFILAILSTVLLFTGNIITF